MAFCEYCKKWITQPEKRRKKRFCNSTCRHNFWYGKNKKGKSGEEKLDAKIEFKETTPESFDAPKMNSMILDEAGQWARSNDDQPLSFDSLKKQEGLKFALTPGDAARLMNKFWEDKREILDAEEYQVWLGKLEASALTRKQKDLVKNTNQ